MANDEIKDENINVPVSENCEICGYPNLLHTPNPNYCPSGEQNRTVRASKTICPRALTTFIILGSLVISSCSSILTPALITELAKDNASFCAHVDIHGGMGGGALTPMPVIPMGGYGSSTFSFCRSNHAMATVTMAPDGSISIKHDK